MISGEKDLELDKSKNESLFPPFASAFAFAFALILAQSFLSTIYFAASFGLDSSRMKRCFHISVVVCQRQHLQLGGGNLEQVKGKD